MDVAGRAKKRRDALAGLTLGAVLGDDKEQLTIPTRPQVNRTLLDIIREEEPNSRAYKNLVHHHHNKKSWKSFKDRLRLKKAGAVWTSSVPTSDVPLNRNTIAPSTSALSSGVGGGFGQLSRRNSVRVDVEEDEEEVDEAEMETGQGQVHLLNRSLSRVVSLQNDLTQEDTLHIEQVPVSDVPVINCRSSMLRRNSSRIPSPGQPDEGVRSMRLSEALAAEREQIQRVVSSTEAAVRARAVEQDYNKREYQLGNDEDENVEVGGGVDGDGDGDGQQQQQQPEVRMSLMDLLGETDGQIGWSPYSGDEDEEDEEDQDEEDADAEEEEGRNLVERNCCVCMVRHKGSAFIPCGHTFCRLCSRELWVSRGNCPLCNGFILEILDIF